MTPAHEISARTLATATSGAALAAGLTLVLFVLPAERGIDPTGFGTAIGLTRMAGMETVSDAAPASAAQPVEAGLPSKASIEKTTVLRSDEMTVTLAPHSGAEVKAHMRKGDHLVFRWETTGGPVKVDMHGERPNASDGEFTSYWKERELATAQGGFTAPFEGTHGWYWRNKGETPVTVTVRTTGFYKDLFRPAEG